MTIAALHKPSRAAVEFLVIDHAEKVPTGN
jgi:hypothetical protein